MTTLKYGDTLQLFRSNTYVCELESSQNANTNVVGSTSNGDSSAWKIESVKTAQVGVKVKSGDIVKLKNKSSKKYLRGTTQLGGSYEGYSFDYVRTDDGTSSESKEYEWKISGVNASSGDSLEDGQNVLLISQSSNYYLSIAFTASQYGISAPGAVYGIFTSDEGPTGNTQWNLQGISHPSGSGDGGDGDNNNNNNNGDNNNNGNNSNPAGTSSVVLSLKPGDNFGVTVLTNTEGPHQVLLADADSGSAIGTLHSPTDNDPSGKDPINNGVISSATYAAGATGKVRVTVTTGNNVCTVKSAQGSVDGTLSFAVVGASDDAKNVFHDCIVFINYPIAS
jgi:Fucose-binding lectin II (PA-IIL)